MNLGDLVNKMSGNTATIISGAISMLGGFAGALGAYLVMRWEMKHDKKNEEKNELLQIKKTLKKLQLLNEYTKEFVTSFDIELNKPYNEEMGFKLKASESSMYWIASSVNNADESLLNEGYMLDYIKFNHLINHTYNELITFNNLPEDQKYYNLSGFFEVINKLKEDIISFEIYTEEQLKKLEK